MISRVLIGDNNLSRYWPAYQFSRPSLKFVTLLTATDFDTFDHALTQTEEKEQVLVSVLTSLLIEEVNQLEVESSAFNICEQAVTRLVGICPRSPSCQVFSFVFSFISFIPSFCFVSHFGSLSAEISNRFFVLILILFLCQPR